MHNSIAKCMKWKIQMRPQFSTKTKIETGQHQNIECKKKKSWVNCCFFLFLKEKKMLVYHSDKNNH